ncbi:hypothetical protein cypCar_00000952 [Cyprinus carpio]|nr:hypothetical protein cypCar_00000952 [Cyprinus carpio]
MVVGAPHSSSQIANPSNGSDLQFILKSGYSESSSKPTSTDGQPCLSPSRKRMNPSSDSSSKSASQVQSASSSNASLVSKTTDTDLHAQTASKAELIQSHETHAVAGMSDFQGNNSHVGDDHTSPRRFKEEFRCSEGESKESKQSHLDKFGSGDGRNRVLDRPHFSSTMKDRDRYKHYREYNERSRSRYGHSYRECRPFRERSTSRDRHHRDREGERRWDRFSHHRREHHHSQRRPREEHDRSRDRRFVSDAYRPSEHHNRDGYFSHSYRGVDGGYGRTSHTVNGSKVRPSSPHSISPLPGHYKRKRSPSADARQSSDECRVKKFKKKKRNKEKHRHSEKDLSEDSSSKRHKKKKKKKKKRREDEERPHTRRDVTPRREEHDSRARNGAERNQHHISESLHSVHRDHMEDQQQLSGHKANGLSCYSGNELDLCHTGMEKDMKYKYFDQSTTVNSTKTLSNGNGDVDDVYHRTLSDVETLKTTHASM